MIQSDFGIIIETKQRVKVTSKMSLEIEEYLEKEDNNHLIFRTFNVLNNNNFKKGFTIGFKCVSLTIIVLLFFGKIRKAIANVPFDQLPVDQFEVKHKKTWYEIVRPFLNLEVAGKVFGFCTGLLLIGTVIALDAEIKKSAEANRLLRGAKNYIDILLEACEMWKDPNN